jgi:RNA polymerase sigma-70 factor (ECF subfamily)
MEKGVQGVQSAIANSTELVSRIRAGDPAAESELATRYSRGLKLMLLKRTRDPHLASDCCHDTLLLVIQKLRSGQIEKPESLEAFIHQIAVNISIQHFRKEKRYDYQPDGIIEHNLAPMEEQPDTLDKVRAKRAIRELLDQLGTPRDREILRRVYLLDEDKPEVCSALELSAAHFDRVLYRAKQRLRELIDQRKEVKGLLFGALFND